MEQQVFELRLAMAFEGDDLAIEDGRPGSEFGREMSGLPLRRTLQIGERHRFPPTVGRDLLAELTSEMT